MEIEWMLIIHSLIDYSLFRLDPALVLVVAAPDDERSM